MSFLAKAKNDEEEKRKQQKTMETVGWVVLAAVLVGLVVFGVKKYREREGMNSVMGFCGCGSSPSASSASSMAFEGPQRFGFRFY
jgi:heme/copper-type cytochrome/quinol oxidase subunit 2